MPLFRRPDGDLVKAEAPVRLIMPYLMRGRNESSVYHEQLYDLTLTRPWLRAYNRSHEQAATLFHLFLHAFARTLHERPRLNRFISGSRMYDRRGVQMSFAAKKEMREEAPLVTVKVEFPAGDTFSQTVARVVSGIASSRTDEEKAVDLELKLAMAMPSPVLRAVMAILRWLDSVNLMPYAVMKGDPMFTSLFVGNLGSIGLDNTFHHMFEYGTGSAFAVIGSTKKATFVTRAGQVEVRDAAGVRWTIDERIADGYYCATGLRLAQKIVEDPERFLGPPTQ